MSLKPGRKQKIDEFTPDKNLIPLILLAGFFFTGFGIAFQYGFRWAVAYLLLWGISYFIIYAGTCRYCAYYGKKCPIPLEGSCVHKFFEKKDSGFGWSRLFWATFVYLLRTIIPVVIIASEPMSVWGFAYFVLLALFWLFHLRVAGCPNCINTGCPLNPDHGSK